MKKYLLVVVFAFSFGLNLFAFNQGDTTRSIFEKGLDQIKLQQAMAYYSNYNYRAALVEFENLYVINPNNPIVSYRIAECYYELRDYENTLKFVEIALGLSSDVTKDANLLYARALHKNEQFDKAIQTMQTYLATLTKEKEIAETARELENLKFAKEAVAKPVSIEILNIGASVNTVFDDYGPSISADGKTFIFTSRRPGSKDSEVDVNDGKYYEDIFMSTWNDAENKWNAAEPIPGRLNTEVHDACLSISPDGQHIYVYKNFGNEGSGEIYVSKLSSNGKWGVPKSLGKLINTSYWESSASVVSDESKMYFVSERKGGLGMGDIWMAEKISKSEWGEPVNLGSVINTPGDEKMVFIHPDGNAMFIASDGHKTIGGYDIFMSIKKEGEWTEPVNLGYPVNTVDDDVNFVLSADNTKAYYSGRKKNTMGEKDIYVIDVSKFEPIQRVARLSCSFVGKVTDETGLPVASHLVVTDESGATIVDFKTPDDGKFNFRVPNGKNYKLTVKSNGSHKSVEDAILLSTEKLSIQKDYILTK